MYKNILRLFSIVFMMTSFIFATTPAMAQSAAEQAVQHIVLVKFKKGVSPAQIDQVFLELSNLKTLIPGFEKFSSGKNISEEKLNRGYDYAFVIDFASQAALKNYLEHPAHKLAGQHLLELTKGGLDGILVMDIPHISKAVVKPIKAT